MTFTNHGVPVVSSKQWATALSPDAAGTGWNYIVGAWTGTVVDPVEWIVTKQLTTVPTTVHFTTPTHRFPNSNYQINSARGQLRASNGRIFFPSNDNYISYYDPTTESVSQIGPVTETPPVDPNASTQLFAATFDTSGMLYLTTQESQHRPSMVISVNPATLAIVILGYVGSSAAAYTTYGYRIAADTGTATKYVYVAYGEDPWQLWALNITTGATTKLYEVTSLGNIQFAEIVGKGWTAIIDTHLGDPSNVRTQWWCLDGAIYAYTAGVDPPVAKRSVTPLIGALANPPDIDYSAGTGIVGWRAHGSTGDYTYVEYPVTYSSPVNIESLVGLSDGIAGNGETYQGVIKYTEPADTHVWYGAWSSGVSEGPRINIDGVVYFAGYPNGTLYQWDPTAVWDLGINPPTTAVNPKLLGYYGLNGTQFAGIKYARHVAWSASTGRLYCSGDRERNGSGMGVGYCTISGPTFAGVYSSTDGSTGPTAMSNVLSAGLVVDDAHDLVVVTTKNVSNTGTAPIVVFNRALTSSTVYMPFLGVPALGPIAPTTAGNIVVGAYTSNGFVNLYRLNAQTGEIMLSVETQYTGTINAFTVNPSDGALWLSVGSRLVGVNPTTLLTKTLDISSIAPVSCLATYSTDMYMASGPTLYSSPIPSTSFTVPQIDPEVLFPSGIIGRALGPPDFFDLLISTLNEMSAQLSVPTLDENLLRATASVGKAQGVPTFYGTIISTVNACSAALFQPLMDTNILAPSSKTGEAFSVPEFYAAVIFKINDLINHMAS